MAALKNAVSAARKAGIAGVALSAFVIASGAYAQGIEPVTAGANPHSVAATRIDAANAPVIDGDMSDAAWARAGVIDEFYQFEPDPGLPTTERTEVRILYDEDNLYIGVYNYDSEPDQITLRTMARDGDLFFGDYFRIYLDPGQTRRNGYLFEIAATGGRRDAILQNNTENLVQWDAIWAGETRLVEDGWVAEMAIPFRSISYDAAREEWGFDFSRMIRRKNERTRWTSYDAGINLMDISNAGALTGIRDVNPGILDVQVYGRLTYKQDWRPERRAALSGAPSANAYYKITPSLTGTLTLNPDFSDSPLDARQVNTTRFSLFTPETRDFFLQDVATFQFGGRAFEDANNARPFFSRNIGLVDGRPVTILGGGKVSGTLAGMGVGALSVITNETSTTPQQVLSVARVTVPVLEESNIGFIATNGDPTGESENTLVGGDFQYRSNSIIPGKLIEADFFYERSFSDVVPDDHAFGSVLNFPNEPWAGELRFKQIGDNFDPALGFSNRRGIRAFDANGSYTRRSRESNFRILSFNVMNEFFVELDGDMQSRGHTAQLDIDMRNNHRYAVAAKNYFESVSDAFDLPGGVIVPSDRYNWTNVFASLDTGQATTLRWMFQVECCSFYDGGYLYVEAGFSYRLGGIFEIAPSYEGTFIDLPTGYVDIHILSLDTIYNFTPDMQLVLQTQFDNISRGFGLSARYRWEYAPGDEFFVAFGQTALIPGTNFRAQTSTLSIRLGQTFRF
jgi:hypothetical protein